MSLACRHAVLLLALCCGTSAGVAAPQRVMSLNLCADQLLMALLPESRLVSITWLSRTEGDPELLALAARLPVNHGSAEEVLQVRPDLVVAGRFTTGTTRALLKRTGVRLLEIEPVADWDGIRRVTREVAAAVGERERGERLLAAMDADLAALAARQAAEPVRVIGWGGAGDDVPGRDTLFNTILETAGGLNVAAQDVAPRTFDVEQVLRLRPQLLLRGAAYGGKPALRNAAALHPALRRQYAGRMLQYPEAVYGCGVPRAAQLALALAAELDAVREGGMR